MKKQYRLKASKVKDNDFQEWIDYNRDEFIRDITFCARHNISIEIEFQVVEAD